MILAILALAVVGWLLFMVLIAVSTALDPNYQVGLGEALATAILFPLRLVFKEGKEPNRSSPRWVHWLYCHIHGFWWDPCPICGMKIGAHEATECLMDNPGSGKSVCWRHKEECERRNAEMFSNYHVELQQNGGHRWVDHRAQDSQPNHPEFTTCSPPKWTTCQIGESSIKALSEPAKYIEPPPPRGPIVV
jgi:hypothetical protein